MGGFDEEAPVRKDTRSFGPVFPRFRFFFCTPQRRGSPAWQVGSRFPTKGRRWEASTEARASERVLVSLALPSQAEVLHKVLHPRPSLEAAPQASVPTLLGAPRRLATEPQEDRLVEEAAVSRALGATMVQIALTLPAAMLVTAACISWAMGEVTTYRRLPTSTSATALASSTWLGVPEGGVALSIAPLRRSASSLRSS